MLSNWPLIGRRAELRRISGLLEEPDCRGIILEGPAGVGKSRLADEAAAGARSRGWAVHQAIASRTMASVPFGAVAHLLPGGEPIVTDRLEVLQRIWRRFAEVSAGGERVLLTIDDASLLDEASLALVHQLTTTRAGMVLLALSGDGNIPEWALDLWRKGLAHRMEVKALTDAEVAQLLAEILGSQVDGATLHTLMRVTEGNLHYLRDIVHVGIGTAALRSIDGLWRWHGPLVDSSRPLELIEARLRQLRAPARRFLEIVAIGEPLPVQMVDRLASATVVDVTEGEGLLRVVEEGRRRALRLAHPLHAEVLRATTPPLRTRAIVRCLADVLESTPLRRRDDMVRLATWRLGAGQRPSDEVVAAAVTVTLAAGDHSETERLSRAAVDSGSGYAAELALAVALSNLGRHDDAESRLRALSAQASQHDQVAELTLARSYNLFWNLRMPQEATQLLLDAEDAVHDIELRARMRAMRGSFLTALGSPSDALTVTSPAVPAPRASRTSAGERAAAAAALAVRGQTDRALAEADIGIADVQGEWGPVGSDHSLLLTMRWETLWFAGRFMEAEALAQEAYGRALAARSDQLRARASFLLGLCARARGRVRTATDWLHESVVLLRELQSFWYVGALAALAQSAALAGDRPRAEAALSEGEGSGRELLPADDARMTLSRAWVAAMGGALTVARSHAMRSAEIAAANGFIALEVFALHDVARMGDAPAVADRMAVVTLGAESELLLAMAAHVSALRAGDGVWLDEVAERFQRMHAALLAAEVSAEAARAHQHAGRPGLRRTALALAAERLRGCEGACTPALERLELPTTITAREREIAVLAGTGLTGPQIAAQLNISVRTVNNLLQRVYSKLGVNGRAELAPALAARRTTIGEVGPGGPAATHQVPAARP